MTALRAFRPQDLLKMNLTNLDPLTENYNIDFYMHYLTKWPSLFTVAEDQDGNITGYSMSPILAVTAIITPANSASSHG